MPQRVQETSAGVPTTVGGAGRWTALIVLAAVWMLAGMACTPKVKVAPPPPPVVDEAAEQLAQAQRLYQAHEYGQAMVQYRRWLENHPNHPAAGDAMFKLATVLTAFGNNAEAAKWYRRLLDTRPQSPQAAPAAVELITILFIEQRYAEIIAVADRMGPQRQGLSGPDAARVHTLIGDAYAALGRHREAARSFLQARRFSRDPAAARWQEKIRAALEPLSLDDVEWLAQQMPTADLRADLLVMLGKIKGQQEHWEEAVRILGQFLADFPDDPRRAEIQQLVTRYYPRSRYNRHVIGCVLPLTGRYALYGARALRGIELAVNRHAAHGHGSQLTISVRDSGSDPQKAARAIADLAREKVSAVIGPIGASAPAARQAQENRIPIITLTQKQGIPDLGEYVFRHFLTPRMQARSLAAYAAGRLGMRRFAILYPDEDYGRRFMNLFWDELLHYGARVTGLEAYPPDQTDFAVSIKKLVGLHYEVPQDLRPVAPEDSLAGLAGLTDDQAVWAPTDPLLPEEAEAPGTESESEPEKPLPVIDFDALFIPDSPSRVGLIAPQLPFHDVNGVVLLGTNLWHSPTLIEMGGEYLQDAVLTDLFFADSRDETVRSFVSQFSAVYGEKPGFIEAVAYDSAVLLFKVLSRAGVHRPETIRSALLEAPPFKGVTGLTTFRENGDCDKPLQLITIRGQRFREIERN